MSGLLLSTIPIPPVDVLTDVGGDFIIVTLDEVPTGVRIITTKYSEELMLITIV